jgi:predicted DNA-binding transcriptional regulator AlpA
MNETNQLVEALRRALETVQQDERLLDLTSVADRLGVTKRHVQRLRDQGLLPTPVQLGAGTRKLLRWRAATIDSWIATGCPHRKAGG